jgi:hypothetical protein
MMAIKKSIDVLNGAFSAANIKLFDNDNEGNEIKITCESTLSTNNYL